MSTRIARQCFMQIAVGSPKTAAKVRQRKAAGGIGRYDASQYAIDEINTYIAVRDGLLEEAEELATQAKVERLALANEFVESCLRPARRPYQSQCLQEMDAARERKRCEAVKIRIEKLREQLSVAQKR